MAIEQTSALRKIWSTPTKSVEDILAGGKDYKLEDIDERQRRF